MLAIFSTPSPQLRLQHLARSDEADSDPVEAVQGQQAGGTAVPAGPRHDRALLLSVHERGDPDLVQPDLDQVPGRASGAGGAAPLGGDAARRL